MENEPAGSGPERAASVSSSVTSAGMSTSTQCQKPLPVGRYFPVLDHGFVSLVDYMGTDDDIERAARVSYGYGTRKRSKTRGLIRYLRRHKHTTPSEMVELKFHCCMPIFIARQWIRHRTANVNEYSGRYSLIPMLFYTPAGRAAADPEPQEQPGPQRRRRSTSGWRAEAAARWTRLPPAHAPRPTSG